MNKKILQIVIVLLVVMNGVSLQRTGYITTSASGNMQAVKVTECGDGVVFTDAPQSLTDLSWVVS
jgi:hypothetical protein